MPDVIVVGAGPAGATAARTLALGGARVRILDRARFPRNKPCGGAISIRALRRFPHVRNAIAQISTRLISRLHLESPSGASVELESAAPAALMIRRVEFDALLLRLAQEAGAELIEGAEITQAAQTRDCVTLTRRNGSVLSAPFVIAADGANSVVARRLELNPGWPPAAVALDMMEETPFDSLSCADPDCLWVAYGYKQSRGYAYVFPKRTHVNVGIGYILQHYRTEVGEAPYDLQRQFVGALRGAGVLHGESERRHFTPALIPVGGPLTHTACDRVLLAGDAGGFVNGFTAEGIYYGMVSGELAARAVLAGAPAAFERAWRREIGAELKDSIRVQRFLFRKLSRIDGMVNGARVRPHLAQSVIDYARGVRSYRAARRRLLLRFPSLAVRLVFQN